jgi:hypothetical protein
MAMNGLFQRSNQYDDNNRLLTSSNFVEMHWYAKKEVTGGAAEAVTSTYMNPASMFDGDVSTWWSIYHTSDTHVTFDMFDIVTVKSISGIISSYHNTGGTTVNTAVYYSTDNTNWTLLNETGIKGVGDNFLTVIGGGFKARYIKFRSWGSDWSYLRLREIYIYT